MSKIKDALSTNDLFANRHIGPDDHEVSSMLKEIDQKSLETLCRAAVPASIMSDTDIDIGQARTEQEALSEIKEIAKENKLYRSWLGCGYSNSVTPPVIQRNILENPGWYTQYTPYQAEIAQGRLESLLNFQTMVSEMTGLPVANASLLDESTAAAEAMALSHATKNRDGSKAFFIANTCHPQTISVVETRAKAIGINVIVANPATFGFESPIFGALLQYPDSNGEIFDYGKFIEKVKSAGAMTTLCADLLSLALLKSPFELGADIAVGNTQRFGVPVGFGGPHAGYFATTDAHKRKVPGRIIGVSKDRHGKKAYRLSLQTREQHIRREKATSNICTAQALLANMAVMYACYHGPSGIKRIAEKVHAGTALLNCALLKAGMKVETKYFFDTIKVSADKENIDKIIARSDAAKINFRIFDDRKAIGVSFDESTSEADVKLAIETILDSKLSDQGFDALKNESKWQIPDGLQRTSKYLTHAVFNSYHSETKMMRYIKRLESRDLSLTTSMIPLGSCTMKLNAAAELFPITWPEIGQIHPFAPKNQTTGYQKLFSSLESMIAKVTGFDAVSLQPNSGAQGEFAGLLVIRAYHESRNDHHRNICLIPNSAHGTNPASAAMAGMKVVVVKCDANGNIDVEDLKKKASDHKDQLSALMVTYPSTHGVFESSIKEICKTIHDNGGQVYMDGANLNAQLGLCKPGEFGADVSHLNLHKTFAIPHGGGGPGIGPIAVKSHLADYLPNHPLVKMGGKKGVGPISQAPWGSASILPISWMYMKMMGPKGLKKATQVAILNANYIAKKLDPHFPVLFRGESGLVAHECIIDLRPLKASQGVDVDDIAKRLIDFGFHAPTVSFPVVGTFMIEPTESESKEELDRFCDAMIKIRDEIREIENGNWDKDNNVLKFAPHTFEDVMSDSWDRPYSRELAGFGVPWVKEQKFWPKVSRIDNAYGDRNLICTCPSIEEYES